MPRPVTSTAAIDKRLVVTPASCIYGESPRRLLYFPPLLLHAGINKPGRCTARDGRHHTTTFGKSKVQILRGLAKAVLDAFLIFKAHGTNLQRRSGFPSYSWTDWRGRINIDTPTAMNEWLASRTWIIWYKRSPSGITNLVWDPSANESFPIHDKTYHGYRERRHFEPLVPLSFATLRTAPTQELSSSIPASPYPLLQFWTLTVFYRIVEINVFTATCGLIGEDGINCGNMSLDGSEETTLFDSVEPLETILLSESEGRREYYNVMLLEWNGGVAERRGIGTILQSAINNSFSPGPLWKEILLG